jgi:hypothetical protein
MLFFFISGIILLLWGIMDCYHYAYLNTLDFDQKKEALDLVGNVTDAEVQLAINTVLMAGLVKIVWGVLGFVFGFVMRQKTLLPFDDGEFESSSRHMNMFFILGLAFALVIGGLMIRTAYTILKQSARRISPAETGGVSGADGAVVRCTVCKGLMSYRDDMKMYYCATCNRYQ